MTEVAVILEEKMTNSTAMVSFSTDFISHVRMLYQLALQKMMSGGVVVYGINSYTAYAGPAYISSVAAVEAFLNEITFGPIAQTILGDTALRRFDQDWIEFLDIRPKLQLVPQLLFNTTFDRGAQPYQDFELLVKVRNDFVHYKMHRSVPTYVQLLEQRSIALPAHPSGADYAWVHKLSCSEGIRWGHNAACRIVQALAHMIPEKDREVLAGLASSFVEIDESHAEALIEKRRVTTGPASTED